MSFLLEIFQDRQCSYKNNIEVLSRYRCCNGQAETVLYSESLPVALFILNK